MPALLFSGVLLLPDAFVASRQAIRDGCGGGEWGKQAEAEGTFNVAAHRCLGELRGIELRPVRHDGNAQEARADVDFVPIDTRCFKDLLGEGQRRTAVLLHFIRHDLQIARHTRPDAGLLGRALNSA